MLADRFWAKVYFDTTESGCWLWTASTDSGGYGHIAVGGKIEKAHRVAWSLMVGEIPSGLCILHTCDVRLCVNPRHLFLGTQADNIQDMTQKGRARGAVRFGEENPMSRITNATVKLIRERRRCGEGNNAIARSLGVSQMQVSRICRGIAWPHIKEKVL
jgi:hypothetical protein